MADILYLTSMEAGAGKSVVALGILDLLSPHVRRMAVYRPVVPDPPAGSPDPPVDPLIALVQEHFALDLPTADAIGVPYSAASELVEDEADLGPLVSHTVEAVARLRRDYDFVLCVGTDYAGPSPATELALNATLAANLGAPTIQVVSGRGRSATAIAAAAREARAVLTAHGCPPIATIVNRVDPQLAAATHSWPPPGVDAEPVYVLPELPVLAALTVDQVVTALDGEVLTGHGPGLHREVGNYLAGAAYLQTVLPLLKEGTLLVAAGDRVDLAVGVAAAAMSPDLPTPAGIVLTCGQRPDARGMALLEPSGLPVVAVEVDTYTALHRLEELSDELRPGSTRKAAAALGLFSAHVDTEELQSRIRLSQSDVVTPQMFSSRLLERARADRRTIVLPEGDDERVLLAAEQLVHRAVADLVLLGDPTAVSGRAAQLGLDLAGIEIVDPLTSPLRKEFATTYAELRAHRGVTWDAAFDVVADPSYFGTLMVHAGHVDGMVSGARHTTAHTIRPALEIIRTEPDVTLVSSAFLMCLPTRVLVFADCAVIPDPDAGQLADIALCAAETAASFGIEPRLALLSYSTGQSGSGADVEKVRKAADLVAQRRPDLPLAGPIQYDAAVDPTVAAAKLPGNPVAGQATVFVFPDLNTGNTTYKAVQRATGAVAIGPVLQGLRRPVNDLSRGCTVPDIVNTVAITAIQAQR